MKKIFIAILLFLCFTITVNAQSTSYRVFTRSTLPTFCQQSASSTDIVIVADVMYICIDPLAAWPANWNLIGFTGGTITSSIIPNANNTLDLGSGANAFRTIYFGTSILSAADGGAIGAVGANRPHVYAYGLSSGAVASVAGEIRWASGNNMTRITSGNLQVGSTTHIGFSSGDPGAAATDVGLIRNAAGKLRVSNGSTGYGTISGAAATVYRSTTQSINNATWTSVGFDTELDDTNTFHDNVTNNSRITIGSAALAGRITFKCTVEMAANATGARAIRLFKNGTTVILGPINYVAITGDPTTMSFSVDIPDAANADFYECQVFQAAGGALNTGSGRQSVIFSAKTY